MKKRRKQKTQTRPKRTSFTINLEQSRFFALIAFALVFVAIIIMFSDFVFSDEMLRGSDTLQAGYFFRSFLVDYVKEHGEIPGWNPFIFCGMPYVAAFHGDIFYPLSLIKYVGPLDRMLGWILILHIYLAGIFMYLCARQFKLDKIPSFVAGIAYMFAPYLVSFIAPGHDGKIFVTALFPLMFLFLDRGFEQKPILNFSLLGIVIGFIILSPHPQMAYFTLWCLSLYAAYRLILLWRETRSIAPAIKPALLTTYAVVIGLLLSAIQFYPGYIYTTNFSPRAEGDSKSGWEWATSWSLHEEEAMGLLIPEFPGANTSTQETYYWGKNAFKDNSESVAVTALFLALIGVFFSRRTIRWFFGGLALFALLYALADTTPAFRLFYLIPNVSSMRAPAMIMFVFSFCIALLAGMGVQYLINRREEAEESDSGRDKKLTYLLIGFPVFLLVVAFAWNAATNSMLGLWEALFYESLSEPIQRTMSKMDLAQYNLSAIKTGAWFSFLAIAAASAVIMVYRRKSAGRWILLGLSLIIVLNSMRFNSRFIETIPLENVYKYNPIHQFLDGRTDYDRVMNMMRPNSNNLPQFGFMVPYGYHGNQLRWYDRLAGGPEMANRVNPRFLNMVSAHWLVITATQQPPPRDYFGPKPFMVVADLGAVKIYENHNAYPRAYLADRYRLFEDVDAMYRAVYADQEDLSQLIYLEKEPGISITEDAQGEPGTAEIAVYTIDSIVIDVNTSRNQLLVLTDTYYDAWHARIDGQPAEILRANTAFRAVAVPAGSHQVVMYFDSQRYETGKTVTLLTSLFLIIIVGYYGVQSYRNRSRETEAA